MFRLVEKTGARQEASEYRLEAEVASYLERHADHPDA